MQAEQADFKQETRERFDQQDKRFDQMQAEQADFKQETRERFDQMDERFEKIEDTLAIIVNHLQK